MIKPHKNMTSEMRVRVLALNLIRQVIAEHNIKSFDDFTCPRMRALAEEIINGRPPQHMKLRGLLAMIAGYGAGIAWAAFNLTGHPENTNLVVGIGVVISLSAIAVRAWVVDRDRR